MILLILAITFSILALIPLVLGAANLRQYRPPPSFDPSASTPKVSLLIPARNEASAIHDAVVSALASRGVELEVIVLDDHSTDTTAEQVRRHAQADPRVRLEAAPPLPPGWCGKQHACSQLARLARHDILCWIDADVGLEPDGLARAVSFLRASHADLVSGIPRQVTGSFLEHLLIPLIHFVLLGFLPMGMMRRARSAAFGAGCGQLFMTTRAAYEKAGGHGAIKASLHDGLQLPRAYRRAGLSTDLFDATEVAHCRMYRGAGEVWWGLSKNATEGMAGPGAILPWTFILIFGQVLPALLGVWAIVSLITPQLAKEAFPGEWKEAVMFHPLNIQPWIEMLASCDTPRAAVFLFGFAIFFVPVSAILLRCCFVVRFHQPILGSLLHPLGVLLLVVIQWHALLRKLLGKPSAWRGRAYPAA